MQITRRRPAAALLIGVAILAGPATAANPMVGGMPMDENSDIITNAATSPDHTTLMAALEAAGLLETLQGAGPFTVFAPVNAAFEALPEGTLEDLLEPENRARLEQVLTCHVVAGEPLLSAALMMAADDSGSAMAAEPMAAEPMAMDAMSADAMATDAMSMGDMSMGDTALATLGGCMLAIAGTGDSLTITDETGGVATVTIADVLQSNGVIHVIDRVLLPGM